MTKDEEMMQLAIVIVAKKDKVTAKRLMEIADKYKEEIEFELDIREHVKVKVVKDNTLKDLWLCFICDYVLLDDPDIGKMVNELLFLKKKFQESEFDNCHDYLEQVMDE